MTKKFEVFIWLFLCLIPPLGASAAEVVVLRSSDIKPYNDAVEGFRSACGCTVRQQAGPSDDADAVFAVGVDAYRQAKGIRDIPVIYVMVPSTGERSSEPPNFSGVLMQISPNRYLEMIAEVLPSARRIGIIVGRDEKAFPASAQTYAHALDLELVIRHSSGPASVPSIIDSLKGKIDALWIVPDQAVVNAETLNYMLLFSFQNRVPAISFAKKHVEMGALAALSIDPYALGVQAGELARKILREGPARQHRLEPRNAVLSLNLRIAEKLGLRMKEEILRRAEIVR